MSIEQQLARFVARTDSRDILPQALRVVRQILATVLGTAIAGAEEAGVREVIGVYGAPAQTPSARVLVHGMRVAPASAATINGLMARALDFCDAVAPGLHIGSSLVPAALAAAEMMGGCSGEAFLAALTVGAELASRMNLTEAGYAGLDPTGIAGVFGATAAAARVLGLDEAQTGHALALAFNRCGGSFQSNIDGSLAVRMIQGWVAGDGLNCALLARAGLTGPGNFVSGVYGYARLFAKAPDFEARVVRGLGSDYRVLRTMFKKYPSCGMSQGATELALRLAQAHRIDANRIDHIEVRVPDYGFKLVGHEFTLGENPRVNAQFSLQYCIANALVRRASTLEHFRPERIGDPAVLALVRRVWPLHEPALDARDHTSVALAITMSDGTVLRDELDVAPGFPDRPLSDAEHLERFDACLDYAGCGDAQRRALTECLASIDRCTDVRRLIALSLIRP
ncbi:MAG: MmgE/PrpD family protein [Variovorax sp.]|nr:MmgE/PrpD family protein [Variovorax sp.]